MDVIVGILFVVFVFVVFAIWGIMKLFSAMMEPGKAGAPSSRPRPELSVADLRTTLQSGELPNPVSVSFRLEPGEECVGISDVTVEQWLEGDSTYMHKYVGWAGGLTGLAVGKAVSAVGNARRRAKAAREAAEQWRSIGRHRVYITTERIILEGGGGGRKWRELWHGDLRRVERAPGAIIVQAVGEPPTRFNMAPLDYWYLLLRRVVFDELPESAA